MPRAYTSPTRDRIYALLEQDGPMTCAEIAQALGMEKKTVSSCLIHFRKKFGSEVFRISGYFRRVGEHGREAAIFAIGPGADAKRPCMNTERDRKAIQERYREKYRIVLRLRDRKRKGIAGNHFLNILGVRL